MAALVGRAAASRRARGACVRLGRPRRAIVRARTGEGDPSSSIPSAADPVFALERALLRDVERMERRMERLQEDLPTRPGARTWSKRSSEERDLPGGGCVVFCTPRAAPPPPPRGVALSGASAHRYIRSYSSETYTVIGEPFAGGRSAHAGGAGGATAAVPWLLGFAYAAVAARAALNWTKTVFRKEWAVPLAVLWGPLAAASPKFRTELRKALANKEPPEAKK